MELYLYNYRMEILYKLERLLQQQVIHLDLDLDLLQLKLIVML